MIQNLNEELFSFIKKSPTGFHAVHELANYLTEAGFERLAEGNTWNLAEGGKYLDRKSTRLNSSHANIAYAVFCLKKTWCPDDDDG